MKLSRTLGLGLALWLASASVSFAQTWTALKNQPIFSANDALLLTDGRVIVQATNSSDWWTLTPDDTGSYVNGTWTQVASLQFWVFPPVSRRRHSARRAARDRGRRIQR
jgi:hypothetical protein